MEYEDHETEKVHDERAREDNEKPLDPTQLYDVHAGFAVWRQPPLFRLALRVWPGMRSNSSGSTSGTLASTASNFFRLALLARLARYLFVI